MVNQVSRLGGAGVIGKSSDNDLLKVGQKDLEDSLEILVAAGGKDQSARARRE